MRVKPKLLVVAVGGLCLLAGSTITASATAVGPLEDAVIASIDGTSVNWQQTDEGLQAEVLFTTFPGIPTGFKSATVFLTEPPNDPNGALSTISKLNGQDISQYATGPVSDILSITAHPGDSCLSLSCQPTSKLDLVFISDNPITLAIGAVILPDLLSSNFVSIPETGLLQDLSRIFGLDGTSNSILVQSDATPVPLPGALPLFGAGLGLLTYLGLRRRKTMAGAVA